MATGILLRRMARRAEKEEDEGERSAEGTIHAPGREKEASTATKTRKRAAEAQGGAFAATPVDHRLRRQA
jgi:hypothetical protein